MSNQPEHVQPGAFRDNPTAIASQQGPSALPALLPQVQVVAPPPHEQAEVFERRRSSENAETGFLAQLIRCLTPVICRTIDVMDEPVRPNPARPAVAIVDASRARQIQVQPAVAVDVEQSCSGMCPTKRDVISANETHRLSELILGIQCFVVSDNVLVRNRYKLADEDIKQALGIRVRILDHECNESCNLCPGADCGACVHRYFCDCSDAYKHEGTAWCAHIHTMHKLMSTGKYLGNVKLSLHIQTDIRYSLMRHVRAYIQGSGFMEREEATENCFVEVTAISERSAQVTVGEPCTSCSTVNKCTYGSCNGCRCMFKCTCEDFTDEKQVCQHVHSVAMFLGTGFSRFEIPTKTFRYSLTAAVDLNLKSYIDFEHEMSYYVNTELIEKPVDLLPKKQIFEGVIKTGDELEFVPDCESSDKQLQRAERSWWVICKKSEQPDQLAPEECQVKRNFDAADDCYCVDRFNRLYELPSCDACKICVCRYTCTCPLSYFVICRHVHAVHRMVTAWEEAMEESVEIRKISQEAKRNWLRDDFDSDAGPSSRDDASPEPKQSKMTT